MDNHTQDNKLAEEKAIVDGLQKASQILKSTLTTVQVDDVTITITAEPMVIDIQFPQETNIETLAGKLKRCLNNAFQKSCESILEQALDQEKIQ